MFVFSEFGRYPTIMNFVKNHINIRRSDGSFINSYISPFIAILYGYGSSNNWQNALKLCRTIKVWYLDLSF